jgi:hypothetical protein
LGKGDVDSCRDCGEKRIAFNGANEGSGNLPSKFGWELIETATVGG